MTDTDLDDRLARLGDHLDAEIDAEIDVVTGSGMDAVTNAGVSAAVDAGSRPDDGGAPWRARTRRVTAAAAAVVAAIALGNTVLAPDDPTEVTAIDRSCERGAESDEIGPSEIGPVVGHALLPLVADPPSFFGEPRAAHRSGGHRRGAWTSLALARPADAGWTSPIWLAATDGSFAPLEPGDETIIEDRTYRTRTFGDVTYLASESSPQRIASGAVDRSTLAAVLSTAEASVSPSGLALTVAVDDLPSGYCVLATPRPHGPDTADRRVLASQHGTVAINEVSDWPSATLAAAATGADLERVATPVEGWSGIADAGDEPLRFLTWSPVPGVVFEITTTDATLTTADLADLASRTTAVDPTTWADRYEP